MQRIILVLWPSFIAAGVMDIVLFTLLDPIALSYQDAPLFTTRLSAYSWGFFLFWLFGAVSSALTCYFQCSATQLNKICRPSESKK